MLSDVDIKQRINKDFIIEPFDADLVNPIGYDLTIGDLVFSKPDGLLEKVNNRYRVPPKATIHILTRESIWLSGKIAGTLHPRVSNVTHGFSHIATTIDPGWIGPLLVTMSNLTEKTLELDPDRAFCTLLLYRLDTETNSVKRRFSFIQKTLIEQIHGQERAYLNKVASIIDAQYVERMREQIESSNNRITGRIAQRIQINRIKRIGGFLYEASLGVVAIAIAAVPVYWESVKQHFHNVPYDTSVLVGQVTAIIAILALLASNRKA